MIAKAAQRTDFQPAPASQHSHFVWKIEDQRKQLERQQRELEKLRDLVSERERQIAERDQKIAERDRKIAEAEKQIADLERQLAARRKNSTNSSKPPSSDVMAQTAQPRTRRKRSRRKPGGQKGHPGHHRPLVPAEQVQQVIPVLPAACKHCGEVLPQSMAEIKSVGEVQRHQVTELPPIKPFIIEYQCPKVACPCCGEATRAPLPAEAQGDFGTELTALVAFLTIVCRMPRRVVEVFLEQGLGISMSLGSAQKCWEQTSE